VTACSWSTPALTELRGPLLGSLRTANLYFGDKSRSDGLGHPAAVGVQCARPLRRVAVITGDGCMRMNGIEVSTAARYRLPIVFVVINNAALGNVWLRAHKFGAVPTN